MGGPPIFRFNVPLTVRMESRISSAVSRRMLKRQNNRLAGSAASALGSAFDDMR
jgi:hypothetical protein